MKAPLKGSHPRWFVYRPRLWSAVDEARRRGFDATRDPDAQTAGLIEFTVWEDYGLVDGLAAIFQGRAADDAFVIENVFADMIPELRGGGFDYQEVKALRLRVDFLVALRMYERFVDAAAELGARAWIPIITMAGAAMAAGNRALALAVFAAADQPGLQRDHLRDLCTKMTGEAPSKRSALWLVK